MSDRDRDRLMAHRSDKHRSVRLFDIMVAFQAFGGKSMRATDAADAVAPAEFDVIERALLAMADRLDTEDPEKWADLHRLSAEIRKWIA